jgi:hypothetical protein
MTTTKQCIKTTHYNYIRKYEEIIKAAAGSDLFGSLCWLSQFHIASVSTPKDPNKVPPQILAGNGQEWD